MKKKMMLAFVFGLIVGAIFLAIAGSDNNQDVCSQMPWLTNCGGDIIPLHGIEKEIGRTDFTVGMFKGCSDETYYDLRDKDGLSFSFQTGTVDIKIVPADVTPRLYRNGDDTPILVLPAYNLAQEPKPAICGDIF